MKIETQARLKSSFVPRPYQMPICDALEKDGYKKLLVVMPRRCLSGGSHIIMSNGSFKLLKDINAGDKILSWDGEKFIPDIVINKWKTGAKDTVRVVSPKQPDLISSLDHRFAHVFASTDQKIKWNNIDSIGKRSLLLSYAGMGFGIAHNPDLAEFIGYMQADGYISGYQQPKFTNVNNEILWRVEFLANKLFDVKVIWRKKGNGYDLGFSNGTRGGNTKNPIKEFFRSDGGDHGKANRRLHSLIWTLDRESVLHFLSSVISADGSMSIAKKGFTEKECGRCIPPGVEITISCGSNYDYACDIYWLLRKLGVLPQKIQLDKVSNWKIRISRSQDIKTLLIYPIYGKQERQRELLEFIKEYKKEIILFNGCHRHSFRIEEGEPEQLYDIETKNNHNFVANGFVVHNSGKDIVAWNLMVRAAIRETAVYFYCLPTFKQARLVIWDSITNDGKKFIDFIPPELVEKVNSSEMKITLYNGSIIQLIGSDTYDTSLVGTNAKMIVFSEYALADPRAYTFARPLLNANEGTAIIVSCVAPTTFVLTRDGMRKISTLSSSSEEYSSFGDDIYGIGGFHKAEQFYYGGKQKTLIITSQAGYQLECTPNHPIWDGAQWKRAEDWKIGDLIPVQYGQEQWANGFDISEDFYYKPGKGSKKWVIDIDNADFFYLLGLIHADGNYNKSTMCVTKKKDPEIIDFLHENEFITRPDGIHHEFSSREFCALLEFIGFKHGARNKEFPERLLDCNREQLVAFLQGVFDGDGTSHSNPSKRGGVKLTSTSLSFMHTLQILLLNFGIVSSLRSEDKAPTKKVKVWSTIYNLEITGYFAHIFYRDIGFRLERKQKNWGNIPPQLAYESGNIYPIDTSRLVYYSLPKNTITNPRRISRRLLAYLNKRRPHPYLQELLDEKLFYSHIKEINYSENEVFDFVIPEGHSFFSNGILSHNTPRGKNHLYDLYEIASRSPDWFCYKLTLDDTQHISVEDIEREVAAGEISKDLAKQEYWCFPGDQSILAFDSVKNISDIKIDDLVFSHSGRIRKVLNTFVREYDGDLIEIQSFGSGEVLRCTPNHPIRVYDPSIQTYYWKNAERVTKDDYLVFPKMTLLNRVKVVSYELCMLLAWYITEGSSFKNGLQFTVGKQLEVDRITGLLSCLGIDFSVFESARDKNVRDIVVYSTQLVDFFKVNCGLVANNKKIPFDLISGHESNFFYELIKGDGCFSRHRGHEKYCYTTVSKTLAYQIQLLANSLNHDYAAGITIRDAYVGNIRGRDVSCQESYQVNIFIPSKKCRHSWLKRSKNSIAAKVKSINKSHYKGTVYNFSVQYDESYIVNGRAVHNCSFEMGQEGSVYSKYIDKMRLDGRITVVPWEANFPVHTAWDLGVRDATSIIFFQVIGTAIHIIDCYENTSVGLEYYIKRLETKLYNWGKHIAPNDIKVRELGTGMSRLEKAQQLGINFLVARNLSIEDGIEAVRSTLPKMYIDETKCAHLIKALENYHYEFDAKRNVYSPAPVHDKWSNMADAIRYLCMSLSVLGKGSSPEELEKRYRETVYGDTELPAPFNTDQRYY